MNKPTALLAALLLTLVPVSVNALVFSASFDQLSANAVLASGYTESGIQFTSPTSMAVVSGSFAGVLFGGGGSPYADGKALRVNNSGWVGISAPGFELDSVLFRYGFDWDFYAIENGLMDTTFEWQTWLDGLMTATGATTFGRSNRSHGGNQMAVADPDGGVFDELLIRSTAVAYQGIYVPNSPDLWPWQRGAQIGYGAANHIAFDNVVVSAVEPALPEVLRFASTPPPPLAVPDASGCTALLLAVALAALLGTRWRCA